MNSCRSDRQIMSVPKETIGDQQPVTGGEESGVGKLKDMLRDKAFLELDFLRSK
jgi:hypothetical protein